MSHLYASQVVITDLDILRKTINLFPGLTWIEGKKEFRWYYNGENASKAESNLSGGVEHCIAIEGCNYEVGVARNKTGYGYVLLFDPYDSKAAEIVGNQCQKIIEAYSETWIRDFAEKEGYLVQQSFDAEGNKVLELVSY